MNTNNANGALRGIILAVGLTLAPWASGDQILQTYNNTLTTYLPSATGAQNLQPMASQRGVGLDGALRSPSLFGWSLAGNPFESAGGRLSGLWLDTGTYGISDVDIALPADVPWVIGRSYNARQSSGSHHDSNGPQGYNWAQMAMPEIKFQTGGTAADDTVYIIYGADRYLEFQRTSAVSVYFKGKNGAAGIVTYTAGSPDVYTYCDQHGNLIEFFGFDTSGGDADGQLWRIVDPAGSIAYVGHKTTASTAVTSGFDSTLNLPLVAYDSAERRFTYTYSPANIGSRKRLAKVVVETKTNANWSDPGTVTQVAKVDYAYYGTGEDYGSEADLELVTTATPLSDTVAEKELARNKYYRYWKDTESTEPHLIKYILGFEGARKFDWQDDGELNTSYDAALDDDIKAYADAYFEYDGSYRVSEAWFNGECDCGGGINGVYTFTYDPNSGYADATGYDTQTENSIVQGKWARRTIVLQPDDNYTTNYFDEVGQPLSVVFTDGPPGGGSPPNFWATKVVRNSDGQVIRIHSPANVTAYTYSSAAFTFAASADLVSLRTRVSSGDMKGFREYTKHRKGDTGGSDYPDTMASYASGSLSVGGPTVIRPFISGTRLYRDTTESGGSDTYDETTMIYTMHSSPASSVLMPKKIITSEPTVVTSNNGRGTGANNVVETRRYFRTNGTLAFRQRPAYFDTADVDRVHDYTEYTNRQVTKQVEDANTDTGTFDVAPSALGVPETNVGSDPVRATEYLYDPQGRLTDTELPDDRTTAFWYDKLQDDRPLTFYTPKRGSWGGPTGATVSNQAGNAEACITIWYAVEETPDTPAGFLTVSVEEEDPTYPGDPYWELNQNPTVFHLTRMKTWAYDPTGRKMQTARVFHLNPALGYGEGSEGTNYDQTSYAYDDMGRPWRAEDATATITRTVYDDRGLVTERWIGTDDISFPDGQGSSDDMVKVEAMQYDGASMGKNGLLTQHTAIVDPTDDGGDDYDNNRVTAYTHDYRNRLIVTGNPQSPHAVSKYDNLGRTLAVGLYSSASGLTASTDPTSTSTNRVELTENIHDERGMVWKSTRRKINASTGAITSSGEIETLNWFDAQRRAIKTDGAQLSKTRYDRLGRMTHQFILASLTDPGYDDADDLTDDLVLEQSQTVYESEDSDNVVMTVGISRLHDKLSNVNTGELDTNADNDPLAVEGANVTGYAAISAMWYDDLDRLETSAFYGTNDIVGDGSTGTVDFDRDPLSAPTVSDASKLVTIRTYSYDGTLLQVADPEEIATQYRYDDGGRLVATINNHEDGTPSGPTGDDDVYTRYTYARGLQTEVWSDINGDGDQDIGVDKLTKYVYGTTAGSVDSNRSLITTNNLLRAVVYPDSGNYVIDHPATKALIDSDDSDVVSYCYNVQGQRLRVQDQAGTVHRYDFDTGGRVVHDRIPTFGSGLDDTIKRITLAYTSRGQVDTVTQYDHATPGSGAVKDQVDYTHDDWGLVTKFEQDRNSTVGAIGSVDDREVSYGYSRATGGRNTVRLTSQTLPSGALLTYTYLSTSNSLDDSCSRVTRVVSGTSTTVASYEYLGLSRLVKTTEPIPDVVSTLVTGTGAYGSMDRFGRTTKSAWATVTSGVTFYDVNLAYDANSIIISAVDAVMVDGSGVGLFDVEYTIDGLNRVAGAKEGDWDGSTLTGTKRGEVWTLDQLGNWDLFKRDLDGDLNYNEANELNDDRTHSIANQLSARDTDDNGTDNYTLGFDGGSAGPGNQTDDGKEYTYKYDGWNRLKEVHNRSGGALVEEYTYNGLGYRTGMHYDSNSSGTVDSSDVWHFFVYDAGWRHLATYRESSGTLDASPKEQFVYHKAGLDGSGGSSYIDSVVYRTFDNTNGWTGAADGTMELTHYPCQNWRGDVAVVIKPTGSTPKANVVFRAKYMSYGDTWSTRAGDVDSNGALDIGDLAAIPSGSYTVLKDVELDNDHDAADATAAGAVGALGWRTLGESNLRWRKGYAAYERDPVLAGTKHHVRHRVMDAELGRWLQTDPLGYVDGLSLYSYVASSAVSFVDPFGLERWKLSCVRCTEKIKTTDKDGKETEDRTRWYLKCCLWDQDKPESGCQTVDFNDPDSSPRQKNPTLYPYPKEKPNVNPTKEFPNGPPYGPDNPWGPNGPIPPGPYTIKPGPSRKFDPKQHPGTTPSPTSPDKTNPGDIVTPEGQCRTVIRCHGPGLSDGCLTSPGSKDENTDNPFWKLWHRLRDDWEKRKRQDPSAPPPSIDLIIEDKETDCTDLQPKQF